MKIKFTPPPLILPNYFHFFSYTETSPLKNKNFSSQMVPLNKKLKELLKFLIPGYLIYYPSSYQRYSSFLQYRFSFRRFIFQYPYQYG